MFGAKAELERLARRVAGLEAKLDVILQLTAIQMADPALYEQVIRTVMRWREEPGGAQAGAADNAAAGPQRNGREPGRKGTSGPALPRDNMRGRGTSPREDAGSAGPEYAGPEDAGQPDGQAAGQAAYDQLANMMRYAGREQPVDEAGE